MNRKLLEEKHLDILVRNGSFRFTDNFFVGTSGQIFPYYVDCVNIERRGLDYSEACKDLASLVNYVGGIDVISGGESRDWDFSNPVAVILCKPHSKIYNDGRIIGADNLNGVIVGHVADLNNEGFSVKHKWHPAIKKAGGQITDVFFYVDRMEEGVQVMEELNIERHELVSLDEIAWDFLRNRGAISKEIYNSIIRRNEDRHSWAINMLRSRTGKDNWVKLYMNKRTRPKAEKILATYPELNDELMELIK